MTSDDLGLAQPPAQAAEGDVRKALKALIKATQEFHEAATSHFNDSDYDFDLFLAKAEAELSVTALPDAIAALSAEGSGTIAAARNKDGFALYPVEPTDAMVKAGVAFALKVSLGGDYRWQDFMRDLYHVMTSASSPEDQQKAAATPTIADPDGEANHG